MSEDQTTELTASEKVRAMLKAREADYRVHHSITQGSMNYYDRYTVFIDGNPRASIDTGNGDEVVLTLRCTPEQAIAATLGSEREKALEELVQDVWAAYSDKAESSFHPVWEVDSELARRMAALGFEVTDE